MRRIIAAGIAALAIAGCGGTQINLPGGNGGGQTPTQSQPTFDNMSTLQQSVQSQVGPKLASMGYGLVTVSNCFMSGSQTAVCNVSTTTSPYGGPQSINITIAISNGGNAWAVQSGI